MCHTPPSPPAQTRSRPPRGQWGATSSPALTLNADKTEGAFSAGEFSTYALAAVEKPVTSVKTGDSFSAALWLSLAAASLLGLGYVSRRRRSQA